jgi:GntR family transcriptional regulator, transcriptional repressor for pyruvate dehydrogenase complex
MLRTNSLKPVSRLNLAEQVALQLADSISAGTWKPGDKLPSELQLCETLHIGRSTLREAMRSLAFTGLLRMRPGEGTYVSHDPSKFLDRVVSSGLLRTDKDISDLCETRMTLETELAALSAERATNRDLEKLDRLAAEMQRDIDFPTQDLVELDLQFHLMIAESSKNQVLSGLLRTIRALLQEWIVRSQHTVVSRQLAIAGHSEVLEALKQRQPERAREAMRGHLQKSFVLLHHVHEVEEKRRDEAFAPGVPAEETVLEPHR